MFEELLGIATTFVWQKIVVILCLISGLYFTLRFKFIQLTTIPHAIELCKGKFDDPNEKGQITHFQALTAALSATIGLGNIAGVAIAIAFGGPGAIFWIWIIGFFGMATKFVECTLGTHYRIENKDGEMRGGAMYYITKGLGNNWKPLATFFGVAIAIAAFGAGGMFQSNQAASALFFNYGIPTWVTGLVLLILGLLVIIGGITRIGKVTSKVIPIMCVVYVCGALLICLMNFDKLGTFFSIILSDAFTGKAAASGSLMTVIMTGVRRAIFSNEAGLGSAPIAHAAVKTNYPIREGFVASIGPFVDTIIVCTATAAVIIMAGNFGTETYQATKTLSFENTSIQQQGWSSTTTYPAQSEKLRTFIDGKTVLKYRSEGPHSEFRTEPIDKTEFIRFSYLRKRGNMKVNVYNDQQQLVATLKGLPGEDTLSKIDPSTGEAFQVAALSEYNHVNDWKSAIITLNPDYFESSTLQLGFEGIGEEVLWYVDRVQNVNSISGIELTTLSFDRFLEGFGSIFITIAVFFFAFSTIITWSYYGETGAAYVFGKKIIMPYKITFILFVFYGAINQLHVIVNFTDLMIGLLVIPNTIAIFLLSPKVAHWCKDYLKKLKSGEIQPNH
jgi:AGCS family alanine or glycine:cation symporter